MHFCAEKIFLIHFLIIFQKIQHIYESQQLGAMVDWIPFFFSLESGGSEGKEVPE